LGCLLNTFTVDIVLGDFNINYFNDNTVKHLSSLMESLGYFQIVTKPTFVSSGSLLDHVYVRSAALEITESIVISVYYSDHDAVKFTIRHL
jgi:endonuclease/exonuclease/phosphatase (EEP) superfamily protein YafD